MYREFGNHELFQIHDFNRRSGRDRRAPGDRYRLQMALLRNIEQGLATGSPPGIRPSTSRHAHGIAHGSIWLESTHVDLRFPRLVRRERDHLPIGRESAPELVDETGNQAFWLFGLIGREQ